MALTKEQEEASIERALNQKWMVKLKQYDGADFDSWREEVEGAFTQRNGKWLLEESRRGDGDLQSSGDLRFLIGKEGVKVHAHSGLKFRRCCKRSLLRSCIGSCARLMVASSDELDAHCGGAHVKTL